MEKRVIWVDNLKGLAMISVVLCHVVDGFYGSNMFPESNNALYMIRNMMNTYQMPLFCMSSGYLFNKAYLTETGEVRQDRVNKQIGNLVSIYVLWCLIMGIFKIILSSSVNNEVYPVDLLLIWFKPIGVYWYLYVLIILYLVFKSKFINALRKDQLLIGLLGLAVVGALLVNHEGYLFAFRRVAYYALIFYIGIIYGKIKNKKYITYIGSWLLISSIILSILFWNNANEIYHIPVINLITAVGFSLGLIVMFDNLKFTDNFKLMPFIGRNSLDIYLLHVFFAAGSRMIIAKLGIANPSACFISVFLIAIFAPILAGIVGRKFGLYDFFFKPYTFLSRINVKASKQ